MTAISCDSPFKGGHQHASRIFCSPDAAGQLCIGLTASLALLGRLPRHRILGRPSRADPAAIAALLPPGVTPDEKSRGRAFFWFLDWQFTASNDEVTDPARYQYREAFVLVEAVFEGRGHALARAVANRARLSARHVVLGHRSAYSEELRRLRA
jgi:hypothetical protein